MIIDRVWSQQEGAYFFLTTKSASGKFREYAFKRNEIKNVGQSCKENADKDIYFCPHGFSKPVRKKEFAVMPKLLWADLDEKDPRNATPNRPSLSSHRPAAMSACGSPTR
jgi:hypothetical protein